MYFIKLGKKYINLDNVTTIEPKPDLGYVVHFVGQTHSRSICEMDMADIRREFEKIKKLQDIDKIVLKTDDEKKDDDKKKTIKKQNAQVVFGTYEVQMAIMNVQATTYAA